MAVRAEGDAHHVEPHPRIGRGRGLRDPSPREPTDALLLSDSDRELGSLGSLPGALADGLHLDEDERPPVESDRVDLPGARTGVPLEYPHPGCGEVPAGDVLSPSSGP